MFTRFAFIIVSFSLLNCSDVSSNGQSLDEGQIPSGILGAWEIESVSSGEKFSKPRRPNPADPYTDTSSHSWSQLQITSGDLNWIESDLVFVQKLHLKYRIEGRKIVTLDDDGVRIADFEVVELSPNSFAFTLISEDTREPVVRWKFHRIPESALATKTAQEFHYKSQFAFQLERTSAPKAVSMSRSDVARADYSKDGVYESVQCFLDSENELRFDFSIVEVTGNEWKTRSDTDSLHLTLKTFNLNLSGPRQEMTMTTRGSVVGAHQKKAFLNDFDSCEVHAIRNGADLQLNVRCVRPDGQAKISFSSGCLLRRFSF